jgi:hypothetical protein
MIGFSQIYSATMNLSYVLVYINEFILTKTYTLNGVAYSNLRLAA